MLAVRLDGNIDWSATQDTVARLCASGVHGVYSNGTACEFHCQTEAEFDRLSEMVAQIAGAANIPFQIGISQSNPRVARERLKRVAGLRPSAVQFTLPDWWPPSDEEVLRFVSGLAEAAPRTSLVFYNPPHAKRRLSLESIAALRTAVPSLVGAKLPGGDAGWYADMRRELPGLSVFVPGHTLATGYAHGAHGSYSNVACLTPTRVHCNGGLRYLPKNMPPPRWRFASRRSSPTMSCRSGRVTRSATLPSTRRWSQPVAGVRSGRGYCGPIHRFRMKTYRHCGRPFARPSPNGFSGQARFGSPPMPRVSTSSISAAP
ncbi:dihydrodipicolinate synthase family protein [Mesorhizobium silamurunense]|uniref:dihydrodipicolinate synthase family protein n=1 Tax=Mesorhizobium silamurunense TaxID=499528 RepID=UPI0031BB318B